MESKEERCDEDDVDLNGSYSFGHSRVNRRTVPSGRFALKINEGGRYWTNGARHTWRDTEKRRIEDRLDSFISGLIEMAATFKQHRDEQERQEELRRQAEQRRQEAARQLAERRKLYKAEKKKFDTLLAQAKNWRKSKEVRELIEAVRKAHSILGPIDAGSEIAQWIEWATKQADRLDPLVLERPPSILDEDLEEKEDPRPSYRQSW